MPGKLQMIADLKVGDTVLSYFQIKRARLVPFKDSNSGSFLSLILSDRSGQVSARVWEKAEQAAANLNAGDVVKVQGKVRAYQDGIYIAIRQIRRARPDEINPEDVAAASAGVSSERNMDALLGVLRDAIRTVGRLDLRRLLDSIFGDADFMADFCHARASPLHHAYVGGLLEHTVEMLVLSRPLLALFPAVDGDLLTAAILLHDVGRVLEAGAGRDAPRFPVGSLIGHQALADAWLSERLAQIPDFAPDLALHLRHVLLSHHGFAGMPGPATLEALALTRLNYLSAEMNEATYAARQAQIRRLNWTGNLAATRGPLYVGPISSEG
ncbi:OB-fold nucleic acid binding domain-containing protein [Candidatus Amarolinea aalborgensis]|uniref:OB-fold nucleic acid binding domain-containing protein n=1 Tax=Candidatus Amarolinea aalborgensis TaxID=2249329 RepID=UPI003BF9D7AC